MKHSLTVRACHMTPLRRVYLFFADVPGETGVEYVSDQNKNPGQSRRTRRTGMTDNCLYQITSLRGSLVYGAQLIVHSLVSSMLHYRVFRSPGSILDGKKTISKTPRDATTSVGPNDEEAVANAVACSDGTPETSVPSRLASGLHVQPQTEGEDLPKSELLRHERYF